MNRVNQMLRRVPVWTVYLIGLLPLAWVVWLTLTGGYGPDPVKGIEHGLGLWAIRLLLLALCISPLRWLGFNLIRFRRQIGLVAFGYVVLHLLAWISIDMAFLWGQILPDLYKRPYILIGMVGLLLLVPLAVTSNNAAIRRLGVQRWTRLHRLAYFATTLGMIHFLMVGKVYTADALTYAAILAGLLAARLWRNGPATLIWA